MWWIIGAFGAFIVLVLYAACKVSGEESRREERRWEEQLKD